MNERQLIAEILNQALVDGMQHRNPHPPHIAKRENDEKRLHHVSCLLAVMTDTCMHPCMKAFLIATFHRLARKNTTAIEELAFEARSFFDAGNEIFSMYCHLIDIDPHYMERKTRAFFMEFDRKGKRHYRNIMLSMRMAA